MGRRFYDWTKGAAGLSDDYNTSAEKGTVFVLAPGSGTDTIVGSASNDTITLSGANAGTISGGASATFSGFDTVDGGAGTDTLVGTNSATTYTVSGSNSGTVSGSVAFQNIESLTGGSADDSFVMGSGASLAGSINGGGGTNNTLNYSSFGAPASVNLTSGTATGVAGGRPGSPIEASVPLYNSSIRSYSSDENSSSS
jgi:hypothetical protein